jgi:Fe-S cluster assembly iron-binding protein IscA
MLTISPKASNAIGAALRGAAIPDGAGLRLTPGPRSAEGTAVHITFVTEREPADQVIETGAAADVFIAPAAAELLHDQVLDAELEADGAITFALYTRGSRPSRPGAAAD